MRNFKLYFACIILFFGCGPSVRFSSDDGRPVLKGEAYTEGYKVIEGRASYYGKKFQGRKTANGEIFDMYKLTAAHRDLPFESLLKVTNKKNDKSVIVRVNDRGPFKAGRILDLSFGAARDIDMIADGVADVSIEILRLGSGD